MVLLNLLKQVKIISKCELLFENVIKGCPLATVGSYFMMGVGGGGLSKNVGHHGWPTMKHY